MITLPKLKFNAAITGSPLSINTFKVPVVFSSEEPKKNDKNLVSSMMMVPATAGINAAYYVINDIIK